MSAVNLSSVSGAAAQQLNFASVVKGRNSSDDQLTSFENYPVETSEASQRGKTASPAKAESANRTVSGQNTASLSSDPASGAAEEAARNARERTLRLALADTTRQIQAQYSSSQPATARANGLSDEARRQVMLRNLESMVSLQLAQYTGNEPYSKANYRAILGTFQPNNVANVASSSVSQGGAYALYSSRAAQTLAFLSPEAAPTQSQSSAFNVVA